MNGSRLLLALAAASLTLAVSGRGFAYCLSSTCDPSISQCEFQSTCNVGGKPLFWPNSCVSFAVQKDGSQTRNISYDTLHAGVLNAFAQWLNADCGGGAHPGIQVADDGPVDCAKPEYNKTQPNANIITFHDALPWPHPNASDTLALSSVYFDGNSGEIVDANVEINSADYNFEIGNAIGAAPDLNGVLIHEIGHFLGLSHSDQPSAIMFGSYMTSTENVGQDDVDGICAALPPNRVTASNDCAPRNGFSGECAKPEMAVGTMSPPSGSSSSPSSSSSSSGCATASGSDAALNPGLALVAFGLALCGWRGRLRLRRSSSRRRSGGA